jgi:hypothetical protein
MRAQLSHERGVENVSGLPVPHRQRPEPQRVQADEAFGILLIVGALVVEDDMDVPAQNYLKTSSEARRATWRQSV